MFLARQTYFESDKVKVGKRSIKQKQSCSVEEGMLVTILNDIKDTFKGFCIIFFHQHVPQLMKPLPLLDEAELSNLIKALPSFKSPGWLYSRVLEMLHG